MKTRNDIYKALVEQNHPNAIEAIEDFILFLTDEKGYSEQKAIEQAYELAIHGDL